MMKTGILRKYMARTIVGGVVAALAGFGFSATAMAEEEADAHETAVMELVVKKGIPIPTSYIETLFRIPNAFGEGAACIICHSSNNAEHSYRGLDLTSCTGLLKGSVEAPAHKVVVPGNPKKSLVRRYLRNNRMPLGVAFNYPPDTENILAVKKWIDEGAKDTNNFEQKILPLFNQKNAFGTEQTCVECHMSNQEPPSFHELDMTSYKGIMLGADAIA